MKKFKFLTLYNLKKVIFTKGFIISNIIVMILIVLVFNLPNIISRFSNKVEEESIIVQFDNLTTENDEKITNYLNTFLSEEMLKTMAVENVKFTIEYENTPFDSTNNEQILSSFKESKKTALIQFSNTEDLNILTADVHFNKGSSKVINTISNVISQSRIVINEIDVSLVKVNTFIPDDNSISEQKMIQMTMISLIVSIPMLMIIIRALVFVGVDIVQEKSSKAIETIIASVPTGTHFFSKVSASLGFVLIQSVLMVVYGLIGALIGGSGATSQAMSFVSLDGTNLGLIIVVVLIFTLVTSLFYLVIGGLLASMSNSQEDYQVYQGPLSLIMLIGFYVNMFSMNAGQIGINIIKVISFIPPLSGFTAPFAFAIGAITWWETLISLVLFVVLLGILFYFFGPVYRVSILNYDQTKLKQRIISNFKKARLERKKRHE